MGVNISHGYAYGACDAFNNFREWLGKLVGIDIYEYVEYSYILEKNAINAVKSIEEISDNDLYPLFRLLDREGELNVDESKMVIRGIDFALSRLNQTQKSERDSFFYKMAIEFKDGLLKAIKNNEVVVFSSPEWIRAGEKGIPPLSPEDIAERFRTYVKEAYPTYRLSVQAYESVGKLDIHFALIDIPEDMFCTQKSNQERLDKFDIYTKIGREIMNEMNVFMDEFRGYYLDVTFNYEIDIML